MNQIICDVCGAKYDETADSCPVCGYTRQGEEKTAEAPAEQVKGGRFSPKNVKLRREAAAAAALDEQREEEEPDNRPLLIVIAILCAAIVMVSAYIALRFFWNPPQETLPPQTTTEAPETTLPPVPCAGIVLETGVLHLDALGQEMDMGVTILPGNTTDTPVYASTNEDVVVVSQDGILTAVGSGQAQIVITCGDKSKTCTVVCWLKEVPETTVPATTPTEPKETQPKPTEPKETQPKPTEPKETQPPAANKLTLNQKDISLYAAGDTYQLKAYYNGKRVSNSSVTWKSSNTDIATVKDGLVTVVGDGDVAITATYNGKSAKCMIRCHVEQTQSKNWKINKTDVTISVEESFLLKVKNGKELASDLSWSVSASGIVSLENTPEGTLVTGLSKGEVTVTAKIDGVKVKCIIRVR